MRSFIILFILFLQGPMLPYPFVPQAAGGLNPCLISGWPINEGSGSTYHDDSGNSNNATASAPTWGSNAGFPGSSITMPGSGATATSATLTNFTGTAAFSLAAWVSITSSGLNQIIMSSLVNTGTYNGWEISANPGVGTGQLSFFLIHANASNAIKVHGSTQLLNTGKHYVVATYDGTQLAAGVKLYVDGSADTVNVDENDLTLTAVSGHAAQLGVRPADNNQMTGVLAAAAVYNCVLTPTQVSTYFARGVQVN